MELCTICPHLQLSQSDRFRTRIGRQHLGPYTDLLQRSRSLGPGKLGCPGCAFFCSLLQNSSGWKSRLPELEKRYIALRHLCLVALRTPEDRKIEDYADLQLEICAEGREGGAGGRGIDAGEQIDYKRPVHSDPRDEQSFSLMHSWMQTCKDHKTCTSAEPVPLPKRVLEVSDDPTTLPKLIITNGKQGHYIVLSHCWGRTGITKLKQSLLDTFRAGIHSDSLPRSFNDAIEITRRLGIRYLWIDALCIIQDDRADWEEEAPKMATYYGRSALMISATAAGDSSKGILQHRHVVQSPAMGIDRKYCLRQRVLSTRYDIDKSILATRGWAAQERMLAPRIVHYTKRQMVWECAAGLSFEASGLKERDRLDWDFEKGKLQPFITRALNLGPSIPLDMEAKADGEPPDSSLEAPNRILAWQKCVASYSARDLTVPSDKLHAISGIAAILNYDGGMGQYLAGLWSKHIVTGLMWARADPSVASPAMYRAPSWSWAKVDGHTFSPFLSREIEDVGLTYDVRVKRFEPKLLEQGMVLVNAQNVYGAVKEGSHIVVEGACISRLGFERLREEATLEEPAFMMDEIPVSVGPKSQSLRGTVQEFSSSSEAGSASASAFRPKTSIAGAQIDVYLFLQSDIWNEKEVSFVDMLLLSWVDEEAAVAKRVGCAMLNMVRETERASSWDVRVDAFCAADWKRIKIKLI